MFVAALLCQVILATAAFAVPTAKERLAHRVARRAAGLTRQSLPHQPTEFSESTVASEVDVASEVNGRDNATPAAVLYSTDWAGAVLSEKAATYKKVTGTFVVPTPKKPSGGSGAYQAAAMVGIDGDTCGSTILEAGVDFNVNGSSVSYYAWYEWYPAGASYFSEEITFKAGDTVTVTVEATSKTSGMAWVQNHRTGKRVSHTFSGQPPLCQYDAEWIIEDLDRTHTPFANFGKVAFTNATAHTLAGKTVGPANAQRFDLVVNTKPVTKVTTGPHSVTITYTGPPASK